MRLELNINGREFNSIYIGNESVLNTHPFIDRVNIREEKVEEQILQLKAIFYRQIAKANSYEIFCVCESKVNSILNNQMV